MWVTGRCHAPGSGSAGVGHGRAVARGAWSLLGTRGLCPLPGPAVDEDAHSSSAGSWSETLLSLCYLPGSSVSTFLKIDRNG